MANFQRVKLGDICDVRDGTHDSPKECDSGYPLVTSKHIKNRKVDLSETYLISENDFEQINRRSKVDRWDVLFSMIGTVGEIAFVKNDEKYAIKNVGLIKTGNERLGKYLFYYLWSPQAKRDLESLLSGSTQKFINLGKLRDFPVFLPSELDQTALLGVLSAYDDLIENNEKRIKALEEMAQLLYTEWFVKYSPPVEGWQAKPDGVVSSEAEHSINAVVSSRSTQHYMSLPYNPKLKDRARELRKAGNLSEVLFWQQVKNGKFKGLDFDRQKIIGNYIVDFYCANMGLVIEIDGNSHDDKQEYDEERNNYLSSLELTVIHIPDIEIKKNLGGVMDGLKKRIENHIGKPPRHCYGTPPQEGNKPSRHGNHPGFQPPLHGRGMGMKMVDSGTEYGMVPEGWEVKNVEGLIRRTSVGKKYENKNVFEAGKVPVLDQGKSCFIGYHNDEPGVKASIENPVIVFANHTCYQNIIVYPFSAIQNVLPFIPNDERDIFWLHWATKDLIKFNDYKGHWPEFMSKKLIVPPVELTKKFGFIAGKYVAMKYKLETENKNLSKTRDLLIPQLVTGKRELK